MYFLMFVNILVFNWMKVLRFQVGKLPIKCLTNTYKNRPTDRPNNRLTDGRTHSEVSLATSNYLGTVLACVKSNWLCDDLILLHGREYKDRTGGLNF